MPNFQGQSDVSNLQASAPGVGVRQLQVNTDPYKIMPEIAYRSYHQQRYSLPRQQPQYYAPQPQEQPEMSAMDQLQALRQQKQAFSQAPRPQAPAEQQTPYFVKMIGGFNMGQGYVPAQAWEPGAVAAGYLPPGVKGPQTPQNAQFQYMPQSGPSAHLSTGGGEGGGNGVGYSLAQQSPYFPRSGPGITTGNPYATGPGVIGGQFAPYQKIED